MNHNAYKIHGFVTRMVLGRNSWQNLSLGQSMLSAMRTDLAVSAKAEWFEGWDTADTLFEEDYFETMTTAEWIDWYIHTPEGADQNQLRIMI